MPKRALLDLPVGRRRAVGIDVLRGVLAIWVVGVHVMLWGAIYGDVSGVPSDVANDVLYLFQHFSETHPAVIGFIVLSGYCIHRNGLRRADHDLSHYAIRRGFRILPVYWLAVAVGIVGFLALNPVDPVLTQSLSATSSITPDCVAIKLVGTAAFVPSQFDCMSQGNEVLDTVMVEIWLYVVYAIVCVALLKGVLNERRLLACIVVLWLGGLVWVDLHPSAFRWWQQSSLIAYLPWWWLGAKFTDPAFAVRMRRLLPVVLLGWIALTLVLLGGTTFGETTADWTKAPAGTIFAIEARKALMAVGFGVLIVALDSLVTHRVDIAARVGRGGYSIYAFQAPIIIALLIVGVPWPIIGLVAVVSGLILFVTYERPLTRFGRRVGSFRRERIARRVQDAAAERAVV
jgi:peptidoglycan/LPS O-acetylase OafA/YrhL